MCLLPAWLTLRRLARRRKKEGEEKNGTRFRYTSIHIYYDNIGRERESQDRSQKKVCCYKSFSKHLKGLFFLSLWEYKGMQSRVEMEKEKKQER